MGMVSFVERPPVAGSGTTGPARDVVDIGPPGRVYPVAIGNDTMLTHILTSP